MTYLRSLFTQGVIVAVLILSLLHGICLDAWAVGDSQDLSDSIGIDVPDGHESTKNIPSFIRGFNFSHVSEGFLFPPNYSESFSKGDFYSNFDVLGMEATGQRRDFLDQVKSDSGSILALATSTIAFLYVMPESFSKWPEEKKDLSPDKLWERYDKYVFSGGPVWDTDEWEVNYIGHPYFGAAYYTHAMNKNFTRLESLSYSFMMSTFLYEYGLEAFFEYPSAQDLVVTPLAGALFGEVFIMMKNGIQSNQDKRSEERRVGKECRRLCRSRWSPYH
jgi:hypothetical protein